MLCVVAIYMYLFLTFNTKRCNNIKQQNIKVKFILNFNKTNPKELYKANQ